MTGAGPGRDRVLLIGYGNPARGDDGLGPALARAIAALDLPGVTVEIDYQLSVDHAALAAAHDLVIFADAAVGLPAPYLLVPVASGPPEALGSHAVSPEAVLHLAGLLFGRAPRGMVLALAGDSFGEIAEGLGPRAEDSLARAIAFLADKLARPAEGGAGPADD